MGHYDSSRPGYCAACGAGPGDFENGECVFCKRPGTQNPKDDKPRGATPGIPRIRIGKKPELPQRLGGGILTQHVTTDGRKWKEVATALGWQELVNAGHAANAELERVGQAQREFLEEYAKDMIHP